MLDTKKIMKKMVLVMIAMLMSISVSSFAGTKTEDNLIESLKQIEIPSNLIVKQTVSLNDGTTLVLYYQKEGSVCRLYSKSDFGKYQAKDLNRVKSTSFEITDHVEGKCRATKKATSVFAYVKSVLNKL